MTLSLYLQTDRRELPLLSGLRLLPVALGAVTGSALSGPAVRWCSVPPLAAGATAILLSGAILLTGGLDHSRGIMAAVFCFGARFELADAPTTASAVGGMGAGSGVVAAARQIGLSVGAAYASAVASDAPVDAAASWVALSVCGILLLICAAALIRPQRRAHDKSAHCRTATETDRQ